MNKVLYIILISLFSLTVISCSEDKEESTTDTTTTTTTLLVHHLLRWVMQEQSLPHQMGFHGIIGLLEQRKNSGQSHMVIALW